MEIEKNLWTERIDPFLAKTQSEINEKTLHIDRYLFAKQFINNNSYVLDCACGFGYGSNILADKANQIIGVDISKDAIAYANEKYDKNNIKYVNDAAENYIITNNFKFDVIISFETIEHLEDQENFIKLLKNSLQSSGKLICSIPYTSKTIEIPINPHHKKEYAVNDFIEILNKYYSNINEYYQIIENSNFEIIKIKIKMIIGVLKSTVRKFIPKSIIHSIKQSSQFQLFFQPDSSKFINTKILHKSEIKFGHIKHNVIFVCE